MKKVSCFLIFTAISIAWAFPRTAIGELFSAYGCGACDNANEYLTTNSAVFEDSAAVLRFHIGDDLEVDGNYDRYGFYADFYEMGYIPHMFINGVNDSSSVYTWINRMRDDAAEGSILGIEPTLHTFDSVGFRMMLDEDLCARYGIMEEEVQVVAIVTRGNVPYGDEIYNWVVSQYYTTALGEMILLVVGDSVGFKWAYDLEPEWDAHDCNFVIYAILPEIPLILNGCEINLFRREDYDYVVSSKRVRDITSVDESVTFGFSLVNMGELDDDYDISLVPISIPIGWDYELTEGGTDVSVELSPLDTSEIEFSIDANSAGIAVIAAVFHTEELSSRNDTLIFKIAAGINNLIINDSGEPDSTEYFGFFEPLDEISFYWDVARDKELGLFSTLDIDRIFWFCGEDSISCLSDEHRAQITNYVTSTGGKLFLTGSGIGYRASSDNGFYRIGLGADYEGAISSPGSVSGNELLDNFSSWTGSLPAGLQCEIVSGYTAFSGQTAFEYGDASAAGIVKEAGATRLVYLGFPVEKITDPDEFNDIIYRVYRYLGGIAVINDVRGKIDKFTLSITPNPFNSSCRISYSANEGRINIADISGRIVFSRMVNGSGKILWDAIGQPSGIYFVNMIAGNKRFSTKILLMR